MPFDGLYPSLEEHTVPAKDRIRFEQAAARVHEAKVAEVNGILDRFDAPNLQGKAEYLVDLAHSVSHLAGDTRDFNPEESEESDRLIAEMVANYITSREVPTTIQTHS